MRKTWVAAAMLCLPPALASAQSDVKDEGLKVMGWDITGYVDASYNKLSRSNLFTSGAPSRVFDLEDDGLALQQAAVKVSRLPTSGFGGAVNLTLGKDADVIASYRTDPQKGKLCNVVTGLNADGTSCDRDRFDVTQAFAQYANGPFTVIAGKYVTLAGAEVIWSPSNTNFSRSILFGYAIPFSHTGVRANYAMSDTVGLSAGVNNGWDAIKDTNSAKTLELGATWAPSKMVALAVQGYLGKERVAGLTRDELGPAFEVDGDRRLLDAVLSVNATDKLTLVLNYDAGSQENTATGTAKWNGFAAYAIYQLADQWRLSLRGEYFDDNDGYRTGVVQKWREGTATLAWLPTKAIELRGEVRRDKSNVASFLDTDGSARDTNGSYAVQFLYKF